MNWKTVGRKWKCLNLRYHPNMLLEGLKSTAANEPYNVHIYSRTATQPTAMMYEQFQQKHHFFLCNLTSLNTTFFLFLSFLVFYSCLCSHGRCEGYAYTWPHSLGRPPLDEWSSHTETFTRQQTTLTRERYRYLRRDSNPQSQQACGKRAASVRPQTLALYHAATSSG